MLILPRIFINGESLSAKHLEAEASGLARSLDNCNLSAGATVGLKSPSAVDHVLVWLECLKRDLTFLPFNAGSSHVPPRHVTLVRESRGSDWMAMHSKYEGEPELGTALVVGTSGSAKKSFVRVSRERAEACAWENIRIQQIDSSSRLFCALSLSHVGGLLTQVLPALLTGAELNFTGPSPVFSSFLASRDPRTTHFHFTPYLLQLMEHAGISRKRHCEGAVAAVGSSRLSRSVGDFAESLGFRRCLHYYGLTEAPPPVLWSEIVRGGFSSAFDQSSSRFVASLSADDEVLISEKGADRPQVFTGDVGRIQSGRIRILGRRSRAFEVAGRLNLEIERDLLDLPGVYEVVSRRDGQGKALFRVEAAHLATARVEKHLRGLLPQECDIEFAPVLRNRMGKVDFLTPWSENARDLNTSEAIS